jgi:hypothetical protein
MHRVRTPKNERWFRGERGNDDSIIIMFIVKVSYTTERSIMFIIIIIIIIICILRMEIQNDGGQVGCCLETK